MNLLASFLPRSPSRAALVAALVAVASGACGGTVDAVTLSEPSSAPDAGAAASPPSDAAAPGTAPWSSDPIRVTRDDALPNDELGREIAINSRYVFAVGDLRDEAGRPSRGVRVFQRRGFYSFHRVGDADLPGWGTITVAASESRVYFGLSDGDAAGGPSVVRAFDLSGARVGPAFELSLPLEGVCAMRTSGDDLLVATRGGAVFRVASPGATSEPIAVGSASLGGSIACPSLVTSATHVAFAGVDGKVTVLARDASGALRADATVAIAPTRMPPSIALAGSELFVVVPDKGLERSTLQRFARDDGGALVAAESTELRALTAAGRCFERCPLAASEERVVVAPEIGEALAVVLERSDGVWAARHALPRPGAPPSASHMSPTRVALTPDFVAIADPDSSFAAERAGAVHVFMDRARATPAYEGFGAAIGAPLTAADASAQSTSGYVLPGGTSAMAARRWFGQRVALADVAEGSIAAVTNGDEARIYTVDGSGVRDAGLVMADEGVHIESVALTPSLLALGTFETINDGALRVARRARDGRWGDAVAVPITGVPEWHRHANLLAADGSTIATAAPWVYSAPVTSDTFLTILEDRDGSIVQTAQFAVRDGVGEHLRRMVLSGDRLLFTSTLSPSILLFERRGGAWAARGALALPVPFAWIHQIALDGDTLAVYGRDAQRTARLLIAEIVDGAVKAKAILAPSDTGPGPGALAMSLRAGWVALTLDGAPPELVLLPVDARSFDGATRVARPAAADPRSDYGASLALSSRALVAGAPRESINGRANAGAALFLRR